MQNKFRRELKPLGDKRGKISININTLNKFLESQFPTKQSYIKKNDKLLCISNRRIINHKIFSIMDKDQTSDKLLKQYIDKTMFKGCWWGDEGLIEPIYFIPDMDTVFNRHGFHINANKSKPQQYYALFTLKYDEVITMLKSLDRKESNFKDLIEYIEKNA